MGNRIKKLLMLCVLLIGCALTGYFTYDGDKNNNDEVNRLIALNHDAAKEQQHRAMKIYVSGAVMAPGIYDIPIGARAYEAVSAAGGMTNSADADRVNLAKKLKDGDHVNVPAIKSSGLSKAVRSAGVSSAGSRSGSAQGAVGKTNVNTADKQALESLPGIGPAMAQRIIAEREKQSFSSVDDLLRVKGIGPAKLSKLRDHIRVN